ncbi:hypothetical protein MY3296_007651 [Beauveria thailandica]
MSVIHWIYAAIGWTQPNKRWSVQQIAWNPKRQVGWKSWNRKVFTMYCVNIALLFNALTEWLDTTHAMRLHIHRKTERSGSPKSEQQIRGFAQSYGITMADFESSNMNDYTNFEDFFARRLKPGSRPLFKHSTLPLLDSWD